MDNPNDTRQSRLWPRSPGGLILLGIGVIVLLGLVAAVSRAHHTPGGRAGIHSPPSGAADYLFSIFLVVMVVGAAVLFFIWISERDAIAQTRGANRRRGTYRLLFMIFFLAAIAVAVGPHIHLFQRARPQPPAKINSGKPAKGHAKKSAVQKAGRAPKLEWIPIFIATAAGMVVLGFIGARTLRRARGELLEQHILERKFESLLDDTLDDLYTQKDARQAIIAAYARMEQLFASSGLPRRPYEAPLEYLARALGELRASGAALGRLTGLFQRAKFSAHDVDESMRTEAIEALTQVRDELRAKRLEDQMHRAQADALEKERRDNLGDAAPGEDPFAAAADSARGNIYSGGRM